MKIRSKRTLLWQVMVCGILIDLALIGLSLLLYPSLLDGGRVLTVIACLVLLVLYGALGIGLAWNASQAVLIALWGGMIFGLLIGVLFAVDLVVEDFIDLGSQAGAFSTLGFMLLIFCLFAGAGVYGTAKTEQIRFGVLASIWSAMLGVVIVVLLGFAVNFFFLQRLEHLLASDYVHSGMNSPEAFTFFNALDSASTHLLEAPLLAAMFGSLGSVIMKGLHSVRGQRSLSGKGS